LAHTQTQKTKTASLQNFASMEHSSMSFKVISLTLKIKSRFHFR